MGRVDLAGKLHDARARVEAEIPAEERGLAKFARLTRKDARVRPDQDDALTALTKALMRRRPAKRERITENTLIRVAIDLLLAHADELRGSTEDELRNSVTRKVRMLRSPAFPDRGAAAGPGFPSCGVPETGRPDLPISRTSAPRDLARHRAGTECGS